jgi:nucleoside-triphosphatase
MSQEKHQYVHLFTGKPQVGKSTIIKKIVNALGVEMCGGFYTEEIRIQGNRMGFRLVTLDGQEGIMAYRGLASPITVGNYGVDISCLDELGVKALYQALTTKKLIVIDEIGPMEAHSHAFRQGVMDVLASSKSVVGTIVWRSDSWLDAVKRHQRVKLYEVTLTNRDAVVEELLKQVDL